MAIVYSAGSDIIKQENEDSLLPIDADGALDLCDKCADYAPKSKSILDAAEQARAKVVREVLAQMPNAAIALHAHSLGDLYRVVGGVELQQLKDGTYTVIVRDSNGKITEHAKMAKASTGFRSAALFGYQALNAVVGQANMMSIAQGLKDIQEELEAAKGRDYIDREAEVESACLGLKFDVLKLPEDQRKPAIVEARSKLRTGLLKLIGYVGQEIDCMPNLEPIRFWQNWGLKNGTKPERAKRSYLYIVKALNTIWPGIVQYSLSDVYLTDGERGTSVDLMRKLEEHVNNLIADGKTKLVPMLGKIDPVKQALALRDGIEEAANALEKCFEHKSSDRVLIPVRGKYIQEVVNG